jgi:hypothetical protein
MKNRWISGMAVAAMLALAACNEGGSPTEPILREPTPTPPTGTLVGEWHGTMSYRGGECAAEEVGATASPEESGVRLNVQSPCYGLLVFHLNERPPAVSGNAEVVYAGGCDTIFGYPVNRPTLKASVSGRIDGGLLHLDSWAFTSPFVKCSRPGVTLELVR